MARISREQLFLEMAQLVAQRGTCPRAQVGAVIVRDGRVISMGYNGAPPGMLHCVDVGCSGGIEAPTNPEAEPFREIGLPPTYTDFPNGCTRAIHAEANSIAWAARVGVPTDGAYMYCTTLMCVKCAELCVSAGIKQVWYLNDYRIKDGLNLLQEAGVQIGKWIP